MGHKPSLTIAIPAYNEESNIGHLLESIRTQRIERAELVRILVISDGSRDQTVQVARSVNDDRLQVIESSQRQGKNPVNNEIVNRLSTDLLVTFDADVLPADDRVVDELIKPVIDDPTVGVTAGRLVALESNGFLESVGAFSQEFKNSLYGKLGTDTIYFCVGSVRALNRSLAKKVHWDDESPEDSFLYLTARSLGYRFQYVPTASVRLRMPANLSDYMKRSWRYYAGRRQLEKIFSHRVVRQAFHIGFFDFWQTAFLFFLRSPIKATIYLCLPVWARLGSLLNQKSYKTWDISTTTKRLID